MAITFTLDLEEHRSKPTADRRYIRVTHEILDFLDDQGVTGTFFVVGTLAQDSPSLVKTIAARGHEMGFHGFRHTPLDRENLNRFRVETAHGKALLEDLTGQAVTGFRAPIFSLTEATLWAVDELKAGGFTYSSSVMPAKNPLYGMPSAPNRPFRWPNGLIEIPCPMAQIGPLRIPFLGGIYLRYLPRWLGRKLGETCTTSVPWTYCHPYDFDDNERFSMVRDSSFVMSFLLWLNRKKTYKKFASLFDEGVAEPLGSRVAHGEFADAEVFTPVRQA